MSKGEKYKSWANMPSEHRINTILIDCGKCRQTTAPVWTEFTYEPGGCPGCTGEVWQSCRCGGSAKYLEFQCGICKFVGIIELS